MSLNKDAPIHEAVYEVKFGHDGRHQHSPVGSSPSSVVHEDKLPGIVKIEQLSRTLNNTKRSIIFICIFFVGFTYGMDAFVRGVYQTYATASYDNHSLLSTINVLRTVFAAAAQPTTGKLADAFGRVQIICLSIVFYLIGTIVEASSTSLAAFAAGAVLYQLGLTIVQVMVNIVIADLTSTKSRLLAIYIPNVHFIVTAWISGNVSNAVLKHTTWQWGIGMWAIIFTFFIIPLVLSLFVFQQQAKKTSPLSKAVQTISLKEKIIGFDLPSVFLLVACLSLLLAPLTLAGGFKPKWHTAGIIAPLVLGFVLIPVFVLWQFRAPVPLIPLRYLHDRGVWSALALAMVINFTYTMQADYLFTVLIIAFNFTITSATRIVLLYLFTSFVIGPIVGVAVLGIRHIKHFVVAGTVLFMVAFGLLVHYRGGTDGASRSGVIGAQVLLGIAGGLVPYPALASVQVSLPHEQQGVVIGLFLACHSIGDALGNAVSGAIWTQVLPKRLAQDLAFQSNATLSVAAFANPFAVAAVYPVGTEVRTAIIGSYQHVQRLLCITGLCLCVPLIALAFCLRNPRLTKAQTLANEGGAGDVVTKEEKVTR